MTGLSTFPTMSAVTTSSVVVGSVLTLSTAAAAAAAAGGGMNGSSLAGDLSLSFTGEISPNRLLTSTHPIWDCGIAKYTSSSPGSF